ncbi:hypothetical protein FIV00_02785 [Labrenzia sp. THAF82]|nr:hypothetical protein FIV00_02785 [Labrenzia sp. THAF82]
MCQTKAFSGDAVFLSGVLATHATGIAPVPIDLQVHAAREG